MANDDFHIIRPWADQGNFWEVMVPNAPCQMMQFTKPPNLDAVSKYLMERYAKTYAMSAHALMQWIYELDWSYHVHPFVD